MAKTSRDIIEEGVSGFEAELEDLENKLADADKDAVMWEKKYDEVSAKLENAELAIEQLRAELKDMREELRETAREAYQSGRDIGREEIDCI